MSTNLVATIIVYIKLISYHKYYQIFYQYDDQKILNQYKILENQNTAPDASRNQSVLHIRRHTPYKYVQYNISQK